MKHSYTVALSVLAGVAIGAIAVQTLHAQAKPPVYMIGLNEVSNPDGYKNEYLPLARKSIKEHGGVYVAAGPGTVKGVYRVDLPRPRNVAEIRFQPEFSRIYQEIWNDLRDEVLVSYERSKRSVS